jgi:hypothetical protein
MEENPVSVDLCQCHGGPLSWCPTYRDRNVLTLDEPYIGEPEEGVCFHAHHDGVCGICGERFEPGALIVRLPAPTWATPYGHAYC